MAYTTCQYMIDSLHDLKQHEEQPATRQALFAAICALIDEHQRHTGLPPMLARRVIDMVPEPDDEEEVYSIISGPCRPLPPGVLASSHQAAVNNAIAIMDDLGLDLLMKYSEEPNSESQPPHPH